MCVIAIKPSQVDMPKEEKLKQMWEKNPDGAGYMYHLKDSVHIRKGFMTYEAFKKSLDRLESELKKKNLTFKKIPIVMHFRITTHGGTSKENTHPFPISDKVEHLKALSVKCNIAMAHNGIIRSVPTEEEESDTQVYIKEVLHPLSLVDKGFMERFSTLISTSINGSRLAFLDKEGTINMFGDWKESSDKDGLKYSNTSFEPYYHSHSKNSYNVYDYSNTIAYSKDNLKKGDKFYNHNPSDVPVYLNELKNKVIEYTGVKKTYYYLEFKDILDDEELLISEYNLERFFKPLTDEHDDKKDKKYKKDANKIGGKKNKETHKINQNANRILYNKTLTESIRLIRVPKYSLLVSEDYVGKALLGTYVYTEDVKVYVQSDNWFFNQENKHYYYMQKDKSLIKIKKSELFAQAIIDDSLALITNYEGAIGGTPVLIENVVLYE